MCETKFQHAYPLALRAAQVRASASVATGAIPRIDHEDLVQEGLLACWRALQHFDSARGSLRTFAERVVAARTTSLHRERRCRPRFEPLDPRRHLSEHEWAHEIELRADVRNVIATLSQSDRRLALLLIDHTPTEASRALRISRSTVYEGIRRIRSRFAQAGLAPGRCRRPASRILG